LAWLAGVGAISSRQPVSFPLFSNAFSQLFTRSAGLLSVSQSAIFSPLRVSSAAALARINRIDHAIPIHAPGLMFNFSTQSVGKIAI
jgi:hypothetical protein